MLFSPPRAVSAWLHLAQHIAGILGRQGESGKESFGVGGSGFLPWQTLGLIGLGPKAQKHSQKSVIGYTYDSACKERRSCCTLKFTFLERKKKNKQTAPWANLYCFSIMEMFYYFPYKGWPYLLPSSVRTSSQHKHTMLLKLDYKPLFVFNLQYSI